MRSTVTDWIWGPVREVSAQVYRLYEALLDRTPDYAGHAGWTQRIVEQTQTLEEVSSGFVNSNEFQSVYGAASNAEFVELLFQNVLGRDPGPGAQGFVNALDGGGSSREAIALEFSETQEFVAGTAGAANAFIDARSSATWVDDVYRLYQATLGREADEGGLLGWVNNLSTGREFQSVVSGFTQSAEFQNLYGATTNSDFVTLLYQNVLDRTPSAEELNGWLERIDGGRTREEVVTGFSQSQEFRNATDDDVESFVRALGTHDFLEGAEGNNVLVGGMLSDRFSIDQSLGGNHVIMDMESWDVLDFYDSSTPAPRTYVHV
ncbi:DUF4214 domain-containing protein [Sulfitobacter sp. S190]|uniref:DUF4214 domain-containing protein n=1 Tax=Sulfitobacter sp. S190 TaxID=2867022 RepID=UPI0021A358FD|nr:DUF4214 domain-containing protein [Sulfitobacter sp. S190]